MKDVMLIGQASRDENIDYTGNKVIEYGGAVFYGEYAVRASGGAVFASLKMNPGDRNIIDAYDLDDDHMKILPSRKTTNMRNTYFTKDRERRLTEIVQQADQIACDEIPDIACSIYHVAGLLYGDFDEQLFPFLAERGKVSADMQAFLRHNEEGRSVYHDWQNKKKYMPYFSYLKTDSAEAEILTGTSDRRKAAEILHSYGAKEVMVSNSEEMLIFDGEKYYTAPVRARNLSGRTGRGDTVFASYLTRRNKGDDIQKALVFATAAVSKKMEQPGPLRTDVNGILDYIRLLYPEYVNLFD